MTIDAGFPLASVESTTHAIHVEHGSGAEGLRIARDGVVPADRDLELAWKPAVGAEPARPCSPSASTGTRTRW